MIGQDDAKRAVAVAMRSRWRRQQLPEEVRKEVHPANLLLMGPTGSGKTEIARRLATLSGSPFVKVEATRYTEVGVVGSNADSMVKDLVEAAYKLERERMMELGKDAARHSAASLIAGVMHNFSADEWDRITDKQWRKWVEQDFNNEIALKSLTADRLALSDIESSSVDVAPVSITADATAAPAATTASSSAGMPDVDIRDDDSVSAEDAQALAMVMDLGETPVKGHQMSPPSHRGPAFVRPDPAYLESSSTSSEEIDYATLAHRSDSASYTQVLNWILDGRLDDAPVTLDLPVPAAPQSGSGLPGPLGDMLPMGNGDSDAAMMFFTLAGDDKARTKPKTKAQKVTVARALAVLIDAEAGRALDETLLKTRAVKAAEETGIIFLDEIDKLCKTDEFRTGSGVTTNKGEGVQKELLSLIEGTVVNTPRGPVNTDHILFITSGAFYRAKPSDMLPELQGRIPIRVALKPLTEAEFRRVLVEPRFSIVRQQEALMKAEGVKLEFAESGIATIASVSATLNSNMENIGARRLTSVVTQVLSKMSFDAPELVRSRHEGLARGQTFDDVVEVEGERLVKVVVEKDMVNDAVKDLMAKTDLSKFTL